MSEEVSKRFIMSAVDFTFNNVAFLSQFLSIGRIKPSTLFEDDDEDDDEDCFILFEEL